MVGHTHVSTAVVGTYGYAAPDYIETGHLTSDHWRETGPRTEQKLVEWVKQFPPDSKRFGLMMDPRLETQYSSSAARKLAKLADSCLSKSAKDRPTMTRVVETLKQIIQVSEEGNQSERSPESFENDQVDSGTKVNEFGPSESWKRRMSHLAKLGEQVESVSRRRFMIMQRAKVT
ncbi:hypothetical protein M0R45_035089 [Rubus argutus]|uniref:Uncharacterized protein n=1 Tax=Rubus argutus TaxID=59490 RepID=A0AAW1VWH6_RUBAR